MNWYGKFGFAVALFLSVFAQTAFAAAQCQYCSGSGRGECQFSPTGYHVHASGSSGSRSLRDDHESVFDAWDGVGDWIKEEFVERFFEHPIFGKRVTLWLYVLGSIGLVLVFVWPLLDKITGASFFTDHEDSVFGILVFPGVISLAINFVWFPVRVLWMFGVRIFG